MRAETEIDRGGETRATCALILVHGIAMYGSLYGEGLAAMAGSDMIWRSVDLPGHGESHERRSERTLRTVLGEAADALVGDGATEVVVAGESLGCSHVANLADSMVDRGLSIRGHILFAPPMQLNAWTLIRWSAGMLAPKRALRVLRGRLDFTIALKDLVQDSEWRARLLQDPRVKTNATFAYLIRSARDVLDLESGLRRLVAPTLVLQGGHDELMGGRNLELTLGALGSSDKQAVVIPGAGHSLFWDPQTEAVVGTVRTWLREQGALSSA